MKPTLLGTLLPLPPTPILGYDSSELFVLPLTVPADFSMEYSSGPVRASIGPSSFVRLEPVGARTWSVELGERPGELQPWAEETIKRVEQRGLADVLELYHEVIIQGFFELEHSYSNPEVHEGGRSSLVVTANGDTKHVSVANTTVRRFRDIVAMLYDLAAPAPAPTHTAQST